MTKPARPRDYLANYRVSFSAKSEIHASRTAEHIRQHIEATLDEDDTVDLTQLLPFDGLSTPQEVVTILKRARNELCRLSYIDTLSTAQMVDRILWKLENRLDEVDEEPNNYDWNRVADVFDMIKKGVEPLI